MGFVDSAKVRRLEARIRALESELRAVREKLRDKTIELAVAKELACHSGEIEKKIDLLAQDNRVLRDEIRQAACEAEKRNEAVMADLQSLSDALDAQGQSIQAEAQEVKTKLDEQTALIQQLQQNANDPAKVQELADKIEANSAAVRAIFTGEPAPAPSRRR